MATQSSGQASQIEWRNNNSDMPTARSRRQKAMKKKDG
jgi:hypothetical protein